MTHSGDEPVVDPRNPRSEIVAMMREDRAATRHPSDGGGRAWFETAPSPAVSGVPNEWTILFETGPEGIAEGGTVFLQVSSFWGWTEPQLEHPDVPGHTRVEWVDPGTGTEPPVLDASKIEGHLVAVEIGGRPLVSGERLRFVYGAGVGALPDRFAERGEHLWLAVDGDGDGVRQLIAEPPALDVAAGPPARLIATLPSTARPGESVRLHLAVLDRLGNAGVDFEGEIVLEPAEGSSGLGMALPSITFEAADRGVRVVELMAMEAGIVRLVATGPNGLRADTNPLQVATGSLRVYWLDVQNHSNFSDGTGQPSELYRYARDVAALDIVSVTDHDHWGMRFLDDDPALWARIRDVTEQFHDPGRFVALHGYEWTHWVHGHRHVLVFDDLPLPIYSSIDPDYDHPDELWAALRGRPAITVAHHSAGGPIAIDWTIPPDPQLEPVTEILSVHGSSESADAPHPIHRPIAGNFVRDAALGRGYKLGFIGSSDGHDGHPGLGHLASPTSGLGAIVTSAEPDEALTRDAVYRALMARQTYATSGPRILLRVVYGGYGMGSDVPIADGVAVDGPGRTVELLPIDHLFVQVLGTRAVERVDLVRTGELVASLDCEVRLECTMLLPITDFEPGEWLYVRAVQVDGHVAIASPFFFVSSLQSTSGDSE
ncbi:MAG: DUF3604 domain-containing protein [Acidobacteriota bacterium]